ncbi:MAG: helix-turn-helix transcriptional regulator [Nitrososphaerales archaeon]|jgi:transcriptional regulator with XRE-family HTH domain
MESLGEVLRRKRDDLRLSLREVEEKTGISNAYLSQLENQKIVKPSPSVLGKLAEAYKISYSRLMELSGYPALGPKGKRLLVFRTSDSAEELTPQEERELLEYLRFIRTRRQER